MSQQTTGLAERLHAYILATGLREHPAQVALRAETDAMEHGGMRSSAEQIQLLGLLVELMGAVRVLEIGCFTGYGTLGFALALPPDGKVVTLDVNEDWAGIGRRYWREAGVEEKIELRVAPAMESLDRLLAEGAAGSFDLAYVDADKKGYGDYCERALQLVRPGGLVALDNMLWHGAVADPDDDSHQVVALRQVAARLHADPSLTISLLPIGDGLMLARRR
jgi:predicted O-methyltransferase YrrM